MTQLIITVVGIAVATWFALRRIAKLPSRYDRGPKNLSAWNSLDKGIDPSLPKQIEP